MSTFQFSKATFDDFKHKGVLPKNRKRFDETWKQIVQDDIKFVKQHNPTKSKDWTMARSHFAPLVLLRNLLLGKNVYSGFTPRLNINSLKNGTGFNAGMYNAYNDLYVALQSSSLTRLRVYVYRLLDAARGTAYFNNLDPKKMDLPCMRLFWSYNSQFDNYYTKVNFKLIYLLEHGDDLKGKSFQELFELYDGLEKFNVIRKEDFLNGNIGHARFSKILTEFAQDWLRLTNRKKFILKDVSIRENPTWYYESLDDDPSETPDIKYEAKSYIHITTCVMKETPIGKGVADATRPDTYFYVPVKYLWEVEWIEDEQRMSDTTA